MTNTTNPPTNTTTPKTGTKDTAKSDVFIFELPYGYLRYDALIRRKKEDMELISFNPDRSIYEANQEEVKDEKKPNYLDYYNLPKPFNKENLSDTLSITYTQKFDYYLLNAVRTTTIDDYGLEEIKYVDKLVRIVELTLGPENAKQQCLEILINGLQEENIPGLTEPERYLSNGYFHTPCIPHSYFLKKLGSDSFEPFEVKP